MAITNLQQATGANNQVLEPVKRRNPVLDEISSFHETLETERVHRVLAKWRKRKRDEEISTGTAILEKILRTLRDEVESRKEWSELWDQALIAELKPDRARLELEGRAAVSTLSPEKQTQVVQAVASVLNIEISGEELGKMLSKTVASKVTAAERPWSMPPTPPADQHSPVTPYTMNPPDVGTHIREPDPRRASVPPRISGLPARPPSRVATREDYTTYSQGFKPQGPGDVSSYFAFLGRIIQLTHSCKKTRSPTRTETADHYASTPPHKKPRTDGPTALKTNTPEKKSARAVRNIRVSD